MNFAHSIFGIKKIAYFKMEIFEINKNVDF